MALWEPQTPQAHFECDQLESVVSSFQQLKPYFGVKQVRQRTFGEFHNPEMKISGIFL
jgi:hypothetical protein